MKGQSITTASKHAAPLPPPTRNWKSKPLTFSPQMRDAIARCKELTAAPSLIGKEAP